MNYFFSHFCYILCVIKTNTSGNKKRSMSIQQPKPVFSLAIALVSSLQCSTHILDFSKVKPWSQFCPLQATAAVFLPHTIDYYTSHAWHY